MLSTRAPDAGKMLQGCEKLLRTPCAPGYVGVLRCAMFALLSLLPFLVLELSFGTIPIVVATGFVLLVAEDLAVQLEVPFGDDANDLPMYEYHEQFCAEIRAVLTLQPQDDFTCMESGHSYRGPAPARGTGARPTISVGGGTCARDSKWRHLTMPTSLQVTLTLTLTLTQP